MQTRALTNFLEQVERLSALQRARLLAGLQSLSERQRATVLIESARLPGLVCPSCRGERHVRHGQANGLQRFRCLDCRRTFNCLSGTPMARLRHKDKWLAYCQTIFDPATTAQRAADTIGVHRNTSFRWRHRILSWTRLDRPPPLAGTVAVDCMSLPASRKGAHKLARDRHQHGSGRRKTPSLVNTLLARCSKGFTHDAVLGSGPLTEADLAGNLGPMLRSEPVTDLVLVTDANPAYRSFAHTHAIDHRVHDADPSTSAGTAWLEELRHYQGRLRLWLRHFRGVATSYLPNYLGWQWARDRERISCAETLLRAALGVYSPSTDNGESAAADARFMHS